MVPVSATRPPRPKDTLFCPACGHESPADGDWQVRADGALACPACAARVTRRSEPHPADTPSRSGRSDPTSRVHRLAVALLRWTPARLPGTRPQ